MSFKLHKNKINTYIKIIFLVLILLNIFISLKDKTKEETGITEKINQENIKELENSNYIYNISIEEKIFTKEIMQSNLTLELNKILENTNGDFHLYIKDQKGSELFKFKEKEKVTAASIVKVPIATAYIKNNRQEQNKEKKLQQLEKIETLLRDSNNYTQNEITEEISYEYITRELSNLYPNMKTELILKNEITAKEGANIFANIFWTGYLNREEKEYIKNTMSKTKHDLYLNQGLKKNNFSHKVGLYPIEGNYNDCGIVEEEIVICLLSERTTEKEYKNISRKISNLIEIYINNSKN